MKHTQKATLFLMFFFVITQIAGLSLVAYDIKEVKTIDGAEGSQIVTQHNPNTDLLRPQVFDSGIIIYLVVGIAIGTSLVLLLAKYKKQKFWQAWFFMAVAIAISYVFSAFNLPLSLSLLIGAVFAYFKIFKPTVLIHNISEVLMYSGIAFLIAPRLNLFWVSVLLIIISLYDVIAVWKSKHMVTMAHFMSKTTFAGLMIPYNSSGNKIKGRLEVKGLQNVDTDEKVAILGGGDIAFPLIFSAVALEWFIMQGFAKSNAYFYSIIISLITAIALYLLLRFGKPNKFYPAMPFISLGCFIGLAIVYFLTQLI